MPTLEFDLIRAIVDHGARTDPNETVDPSTDATLRSAGVPLVTEYVGQLSLVGIVGDAAPLFGAEGGTWIGYRLTDLGRKLVDSEEELRRAVSELIGGPQTEVSEAVLALRRECEGAEIDDRYRGDFLQTLREIQICFDAECYIASIALSGKILEVCLKEILLRNGVQSDPNATLGRLIGSVRERVPAEYLDPALGDTANIINASRNTAVHAQERVSIPSRDQAVLVIFAMRDVVRRNLSHR